MVISIDHGNKSLKTKNRVFTSGLVVSDSKPGIKKDTVYWNGKYYSLTEKRISYMRDKTEDDRFFVLTLFAIAYELETLPKEKREELIEVTLLVGLPPAHYGQLHRRFEDYFLRKRQIIDFEFNDWPCTIRIKRVVSYTQALAAAVTQYASIRNHAVSYVIDIGGFTVDVLKLRYGKPDLEVVESFEQGVITLYNRIKSLCSSQFDILLEDSDIDEVIKGEPTILTGDVQKLIRNTTQEFLSEFYNFLRERGIDVKSSKCIFAGGGSILLRTLIERGGKVGYPIFIDDIHANAIGYELLYRSEVTSSGRE